MAFTELFVEHTGRGGIAAAFVEGGDFQDAHSAIERDGEHVADLDRMPRRFLAHAIDADMAAGDELSRSSARLHHPRMPQPFIETLAIQITLLGEC